MRHGFIVLGAAILSAACDTAPSDRWPVRTDSAGVTVVRWGPDDTPLDWSFEPIIEIGAEDGPGAFGRIMPSGIGVDGSGRIHVLDVLAFRVATFDAAGSPIRSVGRAGSGPGELRFPSDLGVRPDGALAVFDFDRRAFVRFDSSGAAMSEVPAPGPLMRRVAWTTHGIAGAYRFEDEGDTARIRLLISDPDDPVADTLASVGEPPARQVDLGCAVVGFRPLLGAVLAWSAHGDRTAVAAGTDYAIAVHDGPRQTAVWRRDLDPLAGSATLAAAELGSDSLRLPGPGGCRVAAADAATRIGFHDTAAHVGDLIVAPDGAVWVTHRLPGGGRAIDVWSATGEYQGTLPAGTPFPSAFHGTDRLITIERDSLGVQRLRVWRIDRPS
jgi:hypothetical protein